MYIPPCMYVKSPIALGRDVERRPAVSHHCVQVSAVFGVANKQFQHLQVPLLYNKQGELEIRRFKENKLVCNFDNGFCIHVYNIFTYN